jgi:hypothetical protein
MEEKDDLIKKYILNRFPSDYINWMDVQASAVLAAKQLQDEIDRYNMSTPSSHSFDAMIDDDEVSNKTLGQIDDDLNDTILSPDVIDGLIAKINGSGRTVPYTRTRTYTLTKEKGYFIYWLMMHFAFFEDSGFDSNYKGVSNNIPSWGREIINSGYYSTYDKAFLNELTEWLKKTNWVYRKPILNEHNDIQPLLERLPI